MAASSFSTQPDHVGFGECLQKRVKNQILYWAYVWFIWFQPEDAIAKAFNKKFCQIRVAVEHAIGMYYLQLSNLQ